MLIGFRRIPHSDRAKELVNALAQRHPHTKFVSIVGDKCIPNLPDARLPMFIIYRKGEVLNQLVAWGADRERRIEGMYSRAAFYSCLELMREIRRTGGSIDPRGGDHPATASAHS